MFASRGINEPRVREVSENATTLKLVSSSLNATNEALTEAVLATSSTHEESPSFTTSPLR